MKQCVRYSPKRRRPNRSLRWIRNGLLTAMFYLILTLGVGMIGMTLAENWNWIESRAVWVWGKMGWLASR